MPDFVSNALLELGQEVRGLQLVESDIEDKGRYVHFVDRSYAEICALVDWAAAIANTCFGINQDTESLVLNASKSEEAQSREALFGVLEYWHEFDAVDESPHLDDVRYPPPGGQVVPFTTIGNVSAALGIAILDRLLKRRENLSADRTLEELGAAWQCAFFAGRSNHYQMLKHCYRL